MYINIATDLVVLARNVDYKPNWVNDAPLLHNPGGSPDDHLNDAASSRCGPGHYDKYPLFRVQVAKNSMSGYYVRLWLWNTPDLTHVDVPYLAFKEGSVYDMYVRKYTIVDGSGAEVTTQDANFILVGHKCSSMPINLL